ncbi:MAG TPA: ATP synthase F1 subunit epsilon [Actinomycetota bacterium]|nr:ATP synthase F1 subunit epsilon [Actinomycetota bacterium]
MAGLRVHVVSPEREIYSGDAELVVARGVDGDVGIMPGHAPMLVELAIAPVRIVEGEQNRRVILVDGGFLHVTSSDEEGETRVDVLAEHAALPEEIDAAAAQARAEELRRRVEDQGETEASAELAKALMRAEHGR